VLLGTAIAALKDNWFVIQPSANYDTFSQESIDERFLTCDRILDNTVNVLLPSFKPIDFKSRTYSVIDVIRSLMYASCNSISITQTCNTLTNNPSRRDVQHHISKLDISWLESVINRILQTRVKQTTVFQQQQHHQQFYHHHNIAIDLTEIPYHGEPKRNNSSEVRRGMAKSGTTHFFTYASAYVILYGRRFTIAIKYVRAEESLVDVVSYLLSEISGLDIKIRCLFLDKGFFTAHIINYLKSTKTPFVISAFPRGRKSGWLSKLIEKRKKNNSFVTNYMMTDSKTDEQCNFKLYVVVKYRKNRYRKKREGGRQFMFYATNLVTIPVERMFEEYRKRFGIESAYKIMKKSRARTSSKSAVLRLLFILISFTIQNEWIYDKWIYLSKITSGRYGRKYDTKFTYFLMLQFIRLALEKIYGIIYSIPIKNTRYVVVTCVGDSG
jgi:putative transposase